jgi:hypothetical protein
MTLMNPIASNKDVGTPLIDQLIAERDVTEE